MSHPALRVAPETSRRRVALSPVIKAPGSVRTPPVGAPQVGARCSCGGSCPRCRRSPMQGLRLSQPGDAHEREAEATADRVMAGQAVSIGPGRAGVARMRSPGAASHAATAAPPVLAAGLRSPAHVLDSGTRRAMESRLQQGLDGVRVHTGHDAAASAAAVGARAYAVGNDIVFGAHQYAPHTHAGQHLLAHELTHVLQQRAGRAGPPQVDGLQRAPTIDNIVEPGFIGPLTTRQRRAAASCPVGCCLGNLGTLNAMPLFSHQSRSAIVAAGSDSATGVGAALHFTASGAVPAAGDPCHCDDFRFIQVLNTTHPGTGHTANRYVDNNNQPTPFYGDVFLQGRGEHDIPSGYTDAGERISTTESLYDRPFREVSGLGTTSLRWEAETCVACVKNGEPDLVLGCATYGFSRAYNAKTANFDPIVEISPSCRAAPSAAFVSTLSSDPSTATYDFRRAPGLGECFGRGDYPAPTGDTRYA